MLPLPYLRVFGSYEVSLDVYLRLYRTFECEVLKSFMNVLFVDSLDHRLSTRTRYSELA